MRTFQGYTPAQRKDTILLNIHNCTHILSSARLYHGRGTHDVNVNIYKLEEAIKVFKKIPKKKIEWEDLGKLCKPATQLAALLFIETIPPYK